jgi:hypothetical protein
LVSLKRWLSRKIDEVPLAQIYLTTPFYHDPEQGFVAGQQVNKSQLGAFPSVGFYKLLGLVIN